MPSLAAKLPRSDAATSAHLAAARSALANVAAEVGPLLQQELERLDQARASWRAGAGGVGLSLVAHDLRGLGALLGAPLTSRLGASLERLLGLKATAAPLVEMHVDAIRAVVREGASGAGDPRGAVLAEALEAAVTRVAAAAQAA